MSAMKVLVTGAAGRLGQVTVAALLEAGFDIRATDMRLDNRCPVRLELANLLDHLAVYKLLEGCDAVAHLGNHPSMNRHIPGPLLYSENATMTANVLIGAADMGIKRLVYASSIQSIGGTRRVDQPDAPSVLPYLPLDGDLPRRPGNPYALSKAAGEQLLEYLASCDETISATALRFPALHEKPSGTAPATISSSRFHASPADEGFCYLPPSDAARLITALLERQKPGYHAYLPASADNSLGWPIREVIERFYADVPIRPEAAPLTSLVDISAITRAVGWEPVEERTMAMA